LPHQLDLNHYGSLVAASVLKSATERVSFEHIGINGLVLSKTREVTKQLGSILCCNSADFMIGRNNQRLLTFNAFTKGFDCQLNMFN